MKKITMNWGYPFFLWQASIGMASLIVIVMLYKEHDVDNLTAALLYFISLWFMASLFSFPLMVIAVICHQVMLRYTVSPLWIKIILNLVSIIGVIVELRLMDASREFMIGLVCSSSIILSSLLLKTHRTEILRHRDTRTQGFTE